MKVLILAIDGLHYDKVLAEELAALKQSSFAKIDILDIREAQRSTPLLWASFITGMKPSQHGLKTWRSFDHPLVDWLGSKAPVFRNSFFWKALHKLGFESHPSSIKKSKIPTIFEHVPSYVAISVPGFNMYPEYLERLNLVESFEDPLQRAQFTEFVERMHERTLDELSEKIEADWQLLMVHTWKLDLLNHLYYRDSGLVSRLYDEMDRLAGAVSRRIDDGIFLIVSDHGTWRGFHTDYGFCSVNIDVELGRPKITDFYRIIARWLHD
ncbi:MAG: alkaline phosphatase family protein [Candidatus Geothermarchaeales archaeon]